MSRNTTTTTKDRPGWRVLVAAPLAVAGLVALGGCSDDESAQDQYCEAGENLESSVDTLLNLDVVAEGANGVESAVQAVANDAQKMSDTASEAASDDVEALDDALSQLESSLSAVGEELTTDNARTVLDAIDAVRTAATGVYSTLTDC